MEHVHTLSEEEFAALKAEQTSLQDLLEAHKGEFDLVVRDPSGEPLTKILLSRAYLFWTGPKMGTASHVCSDKCNSHSLEEASAAVAEPVAEVAASITEPAPAPTSEYAVADAHEDPVMDAAFEEEKKDEAEAEAEVTAKPGKAKKRK